MVLPGDMAQARIFARILRAGEVLPLLASLQMADDDEAQTTAGKTIAEFFLPDSSVVAQL
jgi:hypothetical protein